MANTTIIIPGREAQVINGLVMSPADVVAAYAGDISLSGMTNSTSTSADGSITITFANKTGTKGNTLNVETLNIQVDGDLVINTRIVIPGREAIVLQDVVLQPADVIAAFAGDINLSGMDYASSVERNDQVITFSNKTGTKGTVDMMAALLAAIQASPSAQAQLNAAVAPTAATLAAEWPEDDFEEDEDEEDEEEFVQLRNTRIVIPGREDQLINGIVLDAQMVKDSFSGELDLSGYDVSETEFGATLEVRFSARTGTKG